MSKVSGDHDSDDNWVRDTEEWEQLERMAGHNPELPYPPHPPDIAERIEAWSEEEGMGIPQALAAAMERGCTVTFDHTMGVIRIDPPPSEGEV